jgi:hypothetical protein
LRIFRCPHPQAERASRAGVRRGRTVPACRTGKWLDPRKIRPFYLSTLPSCKFKSLARKVTISHIRMGNALDSPPLSEFFIPVIKFLSADEKVTRPTSAESNQMQ